jgi:hypothetical protein
MGMMPHDRLVEIVIPARPWLRDRTLAIPLPARPSWPWKKLVATHVAAAAVGLVLAAVIYSVVRWDGEFFDSAGGGSVSGSVLVGQPLTVGFDLQNTHDEPIVVERVALAGPPQGIHLLGVQLMRPGGAAGFVRGWDRPGTEVRGFVIPAHSKLSEVNVGLRADRPGNYVIKGLRVWYRAGLDIPVLGRGHYVQTTGWFVGICAVRRGTCPPPQPLEDGN